MNSVRSNNLSLKYQSFTTLGCKDIGIWNLEFVAKTQFLYNNYNICYVINQFPSKKSIKTGTLKHVCSCLVHILT